VGLVKPQTYIRAAVWDVWRGRSSGRLAQFGFAVRFLRCARQTFFAVRQMSTAHGKVFFHLSLF
jgi:hypothetical protein